MTTSGLSSLTLERFLFSLAIAVPSKSELNHPPLSCSSPSSISTVYRWTWFHSVCNDCAYVQLAATAVADEDEGHQLAPPRTKPMRYAWSVLRPTRWYQTKDEKNRSTSTKTSLPRLFNVALKPLIIHL
ncbi:hypothetical protein CPC08DRAFT_425749 [Agrocybe pediades]|nr:hypothetical protein CPC08DRAFT_425749 [Agrocybe pediades]